MSSELEFGGVIAAAVALPVAGAFGAGWLLWQGGKALAGMNKLADEQIEETKRRQAQAEYHRKKSALAAYEQLVKICSDLLEKIEKEDDSAEFGQIREELRGICQAKVPESTEKVESLTSMGYLKFSEIVKKQNRLASIRVSESNKSLSESVTVSEALGKVRMALEAMDIRTTHSGDVVAPDPYVLERKKLNAELEKAVKRVLDALNFIGKFADECGLTVAADAWFRSCFVGTDALIEKLYNPMTPNTKLKQGIATLNNSVDSFEILADKIEEETRELLFFYDKYCEIAEYVGEEVKDINSFKKPDEIKAEIERLKVRLRTAEKCAALHKKLGRKAYLCLAWDTELEKLGYTVHARKTIMEKFEQTVEHEVLEGKKMPFYKWHEDELTQLYSIADECDLQIVIHEDGTVSMQTISDSEDEKVIAAQAKHCTSMKQLLENLAKNWFISYDCNEISSFDKVLTFAEWRKLEQNNSTGTASEEEDQEQTQTEEKKNAVAAQ